MANIIINVAEAFGRFPFGRYPDHGPLNGQAFRNNLAAPALATADVVTFNLDGVVGLGTSFLDEAFGGLVRDARGRGEDPVALIRRIRIKSTSNPFVDGEILDLMTRASREAAR